MKGTKEFSEIYFYKQFVDMRKSINGLVSIVENEMNEKPHSGALFVFCNQRKNILKIVYWDLSGFAIWAKKLEVEKFHWPNKIVQKVIPMSSESLELFLSGINIWKIKKHKTLHYEHFS